MCWIRCTPWWLRNSTPQPSTSCGPPTPCGPTWTSFSLRHGECWCWLGLWCMVLVMTETVTARICGTVAVLNTRITVQETYRNFQQNATWTHDYWDADLTLLLISFSASPRIAFQYMRTHTNMCKFIVFIYTFARQEERGESEWMWNGDVATSFEEVCLESLWILCKPVGRECVEHCSSKRGWCTRMLLS